MVVQVEYSDKGGASQVLTLLTNYLNLQEAQVKVQQGEADSRGDLVKLTKPDGEELTEIGEIIIYLGSLDKYLLGKDLSLVNQTKELLEKLIKARFRLEEEGEITSEMNELIQGKNFFLGRSLSLIDLAIYVSSYSYFSSLISVKDENYVPKHQNLSSFFEQIQLVNKVRQSCPEEIVYLDLPFFKKKPKEKKSSGSSQNPGKVSERPIGDPTRIALKVGKILSVERHPTADKLYVEKIDLGEDEPRTILSGLVGVYDLTKKINELVVVVANLKPRAMRGITSYGMLLCASTRDSNGNEDGESESICEPVSVPKDAKVGELIRFQDHQGEPDAVLNTKTGKDPFVAVQPFYNVDGNLLCKYKESTMMTSAGPVFVENECLAGGKLS
ncbi:tRNA binding domain-containing protein [Cryptosporidium felis]|nr:tRNA binding domain-containing protein [Cryptosporidium felis]